ncbi:MAG: hypothetical protein AAF849_02690 [Bacteroidota bacterium]
MLVRLTFLVCLCFSINFTSFGQFCPVISSSACTATATTNININSPSDVICVPSGTNLQNVNISASVSGGTILILDGGTLSVQNFNTNGNMVTIQNQGMFILNGDINNNDVFISNCGEITSSSNRTLRTNVKNYLEGTVNINGNLKIEGQFDNCGTVCVNNGLDVQNGGILNIEENSVVKIDGKTTIGSGGTIDNDGFLCVTRMTALVLQNNSGSLLELSCYFKAKGNVQIDADVEIEGEFIVTGNLTLNSNTNVTRPCDATNSCTSSDDLTLFVGGQLIIDNQTSFPDGTVFCVRSNNVVNNSTATNFTIQTNCTTPEPSIPECAILLPVELLSFEAQVVNKDAVELKWQTASETNNRGFEIQRSLEAKIWETVDFVEGNGTTLTTISYGWIDKSVKNGRYYYRLKQVDNDGSYEYSEIASVDIKINPRIAYQVFPNPVQNGSNITLQYDEPIHSLRIVNELGQVIYEDKNAYAEKTMSIRSWTTGRYYLFVNGQFFDRLVVVQ